MVLPRKDITGESADPTVNEAQRAFSERVDREAKERREAEIQAAFDVEVAKDRSALQTTMQKHLAAQFFRAGYNAGRRDENKEWEALDMGRPDQFDEMS